METKEKTSKFADLKTVPFQMKKTLIPIEHYAKKESLSMNIVEQCVKIGLLQTRKCKGEVFVVDTPFKAFGSKEEIIAGINSQVAQQRQAPTQKPIAVKKPVTQAKVAPAAKPVAAVTKKAAPVVKPQVKTAQLYKTVAESIAQKQLQKDAVKPEKTLGFDDDEPIEIDEIINTEILSGKNSKVKPEDFGLDINEIDELINEKDLLLDYQQSYHSKNHKVISHQRNWTTAAIISALCLSFSLMCCFWLYLDSNIQKSKISNLRMDNVKLQKNVSQANTQTAGLREEFAASNRKISDLNNQITNLKTELANTKAQLKLTTQQLQQATANTQ